MERTTRKHLDYLVSRLNEIVGNKGPAWTRNGNRNVASIGHFVLDHGACGWAIERIDNAGGGVSRPFGSYSVTAGEMARQLRAINEALALKIK